MNQVAAFPGQERRELFTLTAQKRGIGSIAIIGYGGRKVAG